MVSRGGEKAVNVALLESGVVEGAFGGLPDQVQGCESRPDLPEVALRHPDDRGLSCEIHSASGTKTTTGPSSSRGSLSATRRPMRTFSASTSSMRLIILKPSSTSTRQTL